MVFHHKRTGRTLLTEGKQMVRREVAELNCYLNQLCRQLPTLVHAGRVIRLCEATGNVPADKL